VDASTHIVVACRAVAGWYEVVKDFTPPPHDIAYPYMHAAHAEAEARQSTTRVEIHAFVVKSPIRVGCQFHLSTAHASPIDQIALQNAKRGLFQ